MKALLGCSGHLQDRGPRIRLCRDLKVERSLTAPDLATALPNMPPWLPGPWLLDLWFHDNKEEHDGSVGLVAGVLFFTREAPMPPKDKWGASVLNFTKASLVVHCKESGSNTGDPGSIPGSGRYPGEGNGHPFQYSWLENSMDR